MKKKATNERKRSSRTGITGRSGGKARSAPVPPDLGRDQFEKALQRASQKVSQPDLDQGKKRKADSD